MTRALLNNPSDALTECELTFLRRNNIDLQRAREQHQAYARVLKDLGVDVKILSVNEEMPDGVFVEDTAVVLDELAVITSMGTASRRGEVVSMANELRKYRDIVEMRLPATLEGGDVLQIGTGIYIGETTRTNKDAIAWMAQELLPFGYHVCPVSVFGCLHLKTGVTALDDNTVLVNPEWVDVSSFEEFHVIEVASGEPFGGNTVVVNGTVLVNAAYPKTMDKITSYGYTVKTIDISEFAKAEAGLTCLSLIFED